MKRTIKVGIIVSDFPPTGLGGTEIATQKIAKLLVQRHFEVHIITRNVRLKIGRKIRSLKKIEDFQGYRIHRITCPTPRIFRFVTQFLFGLINILKIKPDIIHGQQINQNGLIAVVAGKILRKKIVVWARGSEIYDSSSLYRQSLGKFIISKANIVLAVSHHMKNFMTRIWPNNRISALSNGVDLKNYFRDTTPKSTIELMFVGRLVKIKRVSDIIKAVSHFKNNSPLVMLTIIGSGKKEQFLRDLCRRLGIKDHVRFIGTIPHKKVPKYLSGADIFIMASQREGLPLAILEAMASSLPILASKSPGISELIRNKINGFLHSPGNIKHLTTNMRLLIQDKKLREEMGERSRELAEKFNWEEIIIQLIKIYS